MVSIFSATERRRRLSVGRPPGRHSVALPGKESRPAVPSDPCGRHLWNHHPEIRRTGCRPDSIENGVRVSSDLHGNRWYVYFPRTLSGIPILKIRPFLQVVSPTSITTKSPSALLSANANSAIGRVPVSGNAKTVDMASRSDDCRPCA